MTSVNRLRERVSAALADRLSPEGTREATLFERLTVRRLPWEHLVRFNRSLALVGKVATTIWVATIATIVLGIDWRGPVQAALNSGRPIEGAIVLIFLLPTVVVLVTRSLIGFLRWRLQRELWRRDVERLTSN